LGLVLAQLPTLRAEDDPPPKAQADAPKQEADKSKPTTPAKKEDKKEIPIPKAELLLKSLSARAIGPAVAGGRICDVAAVPQKPGTLYVASASGGVWKTINNGTTWQPVFDDYGSASIGDVTVAPSNPDVVWVGTGEANPRNSVTWGDGVYKSTDAGKSWQHMGLKDTHHIGRIVIHPKNPNTVYVAALGHIWGPNEERGLFKTTDGGKTWNHTLNLGPDCGCIDVAMDPREPDTLWACTYTVRRDGFSGGNPATQFGPKAGVYKTTDGGKSWKRLMKGLPTSKYGRCGLDVYPRNPQILYAVIQTEKTNIRTVAGAQPRASNETETGGIFRSDDGGESWRKINDLCPRPFYYGQIRIDPNNDRRLWVLGVALYYSADGGREFRTVGGQKHPDHHAMWIDPNNSDHVVLGNDGGLYFTYDRGQTWDHIDNLPLAQPYGVAVDMRKPYYVYCGLQDNGSWGGPSATRSSSGITNYDWFRIGGGDGFHCAVDPTDPNTVYGESQYGNLYRLDLSLGLSRSIRPRTPQGTTLRFNWSSPILLSPHNPRIVYYGGNILFRSLDRGDTWQAISPDLTHGTDLTPRSQGNTIFSIAESPKKFGLLWVGTDDGRLHLSKDGGITWTDLSDKLPGPKNRTISKIEASTQEAGTAFVAVDRHRNDDQKPYLFKTTDYGQTWRPLHQTLPAHGSINVVRQDKQNPNLLFCGTEFGLFVSLNGGGEWHRLKHGLPMVPVHDLVIHPRDGELVIATHGRGIYVMDITPLQQLTEEVLAASAHLFTPKPATAFRIGGGRSSGSTRYFHAANPTPGVALSFYFKTDTPAQVKLAVCDALGKEVNALTGPTSAGIHTVRWNLRGAEVRPPAPLPGQGGPGRNQARTFAPMMPPGDYVVKLMVGDKQVAAKRLRIEPDQGVPPGAMTDSGGEE
jgi:photosystem II stability/assembly factor-like uncharacterized protein